MGNAGTTYTYRITAEGVDAVKAAFGDLKNKLFEVAGVGGLGFMIENSLKTATNIEEMARQAGMGTKQFQELSFALQQYGINQQKASEELTKFNVNAAQFVTQNAGPVKQAFQTLFGAGPEGQKAVQQGLQNVDQFFQTVLGKIGQLNSESEKLDFLKQIFGKGSSDLIGPADAGIAAMQAFREEAERVGVVMSDDVIKNAHEAENRLNTLYDILHMKMAIAIDENADKITHLAQVGIDALPALISLVDQLASGFEEVARYMKEIADGDFSGAFANLSKGLTAAMAGTVMPGLVNPTHVSTGYLVNNPYPANGPDLSRLAFSGRTPQVSQLQGQDFYSMMGLTAPAQPKPAPSPSAGLKIGDPEADAEREANQKLIDTLKDEAAALGESERQLAIVTAQRRLNTTATQAQKDAVAQYVGQIYDEHKAEENQKIIDQLKQETDAATLDARSQFILSEQRKLNTSATQAQKDAIADLAGKYYDEQQAMEVIKKKQDELRTSFKNVGDDVSQSFEDMSLNGKKFGDVLNTLMKQIEDIVYKDLVGNDLSSFISTGLNDIFGIPNTDSVHRAGGGPVGAGQLYQVNENNREYFRPDTSGTIIPLGGGSDSGVSIRIINNAPVKVTPQVGRKSGGQKDLVFVIDKMMADNASNPMSQFSIAQSKVCSCTDNDVLIP